ncbi:hypothetical protein ABMA27_008773 [Loxostege sticticalis]|uniref:Uncharacterized protein n=1 Tax=Loxostege sticticalis TaxID=481309 RepID=A0ABR3H8T0_LOXSC
MQSVQDDSSYSNIQRPDWVKGTVRLNVPVDADGQLSPVLLLPVPVPVKGYSLGKQQTSQLSYDFPPSRRPAAYYDSYDEAAPAPLPKPSRPQATELLELFRAQQPTAPHLPPIVTREWRPETQKVVRPVPEPLPGASGNVVVQAVELPAPSAENGRARAKSFAGYSPAPPKELLKEPAPLRFDRPLVVRGEVTVPRADYTEAYTARWDPASGAATMVLHQGTASTHRMVTGEGQVKRVLRKVDRTGEQPMHRCIVIPQSTLTSTDKIPPFLPDTKGFGFKGYVQYGDVKAELWKQSMTGAPGELGGARGEALTYRHELLVSRAQGGVPMPLMYSVAVDSSVLGRDCDGHVHRFFEAREEQHEPDHFTIDLAKSCDATEQTNDMAKVEPLREFTMLQRDPGFEDKFNEYKAKYERKYADDVEEAVRKNVLLQTRRFVSSGNRVGATFSVGTNYLSDWLNKERHQLLGALPDAGGSEQFPYARQQLYAMERKLPAEFDWRERGAVTPVRFQDACSSCWAFAVTGAVEGALFRRTRRLVPLSEKCLVDCAKPYVSSVEQCVARRVTPVTRISAFVNVTHDSVPALKVAIRRHVPTVVIIDGTYQSLASYKAGVYEDNRCSRESRNHAVLAVGYGGTAEEPHFILKNSWAASWGEGGYVRMYGPTNTCGVLNQPSYPRLEPEDVVRVPAEAPPTAA